MLNLIKLAFNPMKFVENIGYLGVGMLIIIVVMAVIIGATALLNKITGGK